MTEPTLFLRFGAALLIGVLIGLQREYASGDSDQELFAGARTFALLAISGASGALIADILGSPWVFIGLVSVLGILVVVAYFIQASKFASMGLTTEVAALLTVIIGAICYAYSIEFAAALGVAVTVLLAIKWEMRSLIKVITREDVYATLRFAVITAIVLPILPNRTYGPPPLDVLNPHNIWQMIVFISGINFLGYILIKMVGPRRGIGLSGFLGGLASSTANTLSFSQRSKDETELARPFATAIIVGWTVMFVRVLVEVAVINKQLLFTLWPPIVAMGVLGLGYSIYLYVSQYALDETEVKISNPFELGPAIKFGLLYAVILVVSKAAQSYLGASGLYISSFLAGLADVDAITLSVADLTLHSGGIGLDMAERAIVLAVISNTLVKGGIVLSLGSRLLRRSIWPAFVGMVAVGSLISFLF
ncbi:MAG: MgtC/SapB family protein [Chloroflexota bacterium]|nr:MAG: MgtC/SapB family protein [Chloroflexota bacterium]